MQVKIISQPASLLAIHQKLAANHLKPNVTELGFLVMPTNFNLNHSQPSGKSLTTAGISPAAKGRAQSHYLRALEQIKMKRLTLAVQELRDAIHNDPQNSEYYALLGKIHLEKGLTGVANINLRQALKLNPEEPLALECMKKLSTEAESQSKHSASGLTDRLFNFLSRKL
jgi:Flp pilus assembly protein TadD